jgi:hypothetical protein
LIARSYRDKTLTLLCISQWQVLVVTSIYTLVLPLPTVSASDISVCLNCAVKKGEVASKWIQKPMHDNSFERTDLSLPSTLASMSFCSTWDLRQRRRDFVSFKWFNHGNNSHGSHGSRTTTIGLESGLWQLNIPCPDLLQTTTCILCNNKSQHAQLGVKQ